MTIAEVIEALHAIEDKGQQLYVWSDPRGECEPIHGISLYNTDEPHTEDNPLCIDSTPLPITCNQCRAVMTPAEAEQSTRDNAGLIICHRHN